MSLANELQSLYTNTDAALKHCNDKLTEKKAETASSLYEVGDKISTIKSDYRELIDGSIVEVEIPNSVSKIKGGAFYDCKNITNIYLPYGIQTIGDYAFCKCSELTNITLPGSVTYIGTGIFKDCTGLTSFGDVSINGKMSSIPAETFSGCTNLTTVDFSKRLFTNGIGSRAFYLCHKLNFEEIRANSIAKEAFYNCYGITGTINLNSGFYQHIDELAFAHCYNLEKVITKATSIGVEAFTGCSKLTSFIIYQSDKVATPLISTNDMSSVFKDTPIAKGEGYIYVPSSMLSQYQTSDIWAAYASQFRAIEDYPEILD